MSKTISLGFEEFINENVQDITKAMPWMKNVDIKLCESIDQLKAFVDGAIARGKDGKKAHCSLDFETTGLNNRLKNGVPITKIVGIGLAVSKDIGIYIPVNHQEGVECNLPEKLVLEEIQRLCKYCIIIVHNAKFDLMVAKNHGIVIDNFEDFEDTLILARLYDAGQKQIDLKFLSKSLLDRLMIELKEITKGTHRLDMISPKIGYVYGASDAVNTYGLFDLFNNHKIINDQRPIYNLEKRLVFVVMQMEENLVLIDKDYLKIEKERISNRIKAIEDEIHEKTGNKELNIGSTQQLGKMLFDPDKLGYEYPSKTKTASGQYMTDTATLEKIADKYPLVKLIIEYRELEKSLGTYIENLLNNCDENNCVKLSFNQNGTDTGRFSSPGGQGLEKDGYSAVNVQAIPANYSAGTPDIRRAFKARPGKKIVAMDFSGEELRVATNLSLEPKWMDEFLHGSADLHTATAKVIYKKEEIAKAERQVAKTVNFLVMYGGGSKGLAEQAKISEMEARKILNQFFEGLPKLKRWIERERAIAKKQKYARTAFGRIRPLHMFYDSGDRGLEAHADRCATNFLVQGCCADIMKVVMVRVASWIKENNLEDEIKILITMHDELVFEMPEDKLSLYIPQLNNIMALSDVLQNVFKWPVPLTVDAEYGDTWHVDHDFFKEHPELKNTVAPIEFHQSTQVIEQEIVKTPDSDPFFNVIMTEEEYQRAVKVGTLRHEESKKQGLQQAYGATGYNLDTDIMGASGELAYCIYTNQPWSGSINTFKAPDVGVNVQIRTAPVGNRKNRLIVREEDKDEDLFVLVLAEGRQFRIVGSILGKDAKNDKYQDAPNGRPPAWFVPQEDLLKIEDRRGLEQAVTSETSAPQGSTVEEPKKEEVPTTEVTEEIIYKLKDRSKITLFRVNEILTFLTSECGNKHYEGPIKTLKLYDKENNVLSVSNLWVRSDGFYSLARFLGL